MSASTERRLRVLIVSNRPIVRAGLAAVQRTFRRLRVVGEVDGVSVALAEAARSDPHAVLFDVHLGGPDGLAMDDEDNLAIAHAGLGAVWMFSRLGEPLYRIRSCEGLTTTKFVVRGTGHVRT